MNRTKMFHVKRFGTIAGPLSLQHLTGGGLRRVAWREEYVFLSSKAIQREAGIWLLLILALEYCS
ncbi:hypothetical protein QEV83_07685 [Methylocapsa sp. D3K7]|uniref:hypothetical protein n=1 Tax=Methylocapsa sp. D3K7 TaxID=3041435 RepID=UPI00244EAFE0|nr:hypothetical protein [Methylocapsa sp. D3K7]WGJ16114.1 hypothetical protein QEV83_07685 [Methylocapsa sp. D3K7]